jgi:hypothetical protein
VPIQMSHVHSWVSLLFWFFFSCYGTSYSYVVGNIFSEAVT